MRIKWMLVALMLTAGATTAMAQDNNNGTPDDRATAFRSMTGPAKESVPGGQLLVGAYGLALLLLGGYVTWLGVLHSKTAATASELERAYQARTKR